MSSKSSIRRFMTQAFRRRQGTIRNPSPARLRIESLESRITPTGLQPNPVIFQPEVAPAAPLSQEGQAVRPGENLLQFVDTTGPTDLTHLTATITWGDGSPNSVVTSTSAATAQIVNTGGNNFAVVTLAAGAHVYEEAAAGTLYTVSVADDGVLNPPAGSTGASTPLNGGSGVADALLTDTTAVQPAANGVEGIPFTNVLLATFDDANPAATASDFPPANITVNFTGAPSFNGTPSYAVQPNGVSGGVSHWMVVATNLNVAEPGSFTVSSVVIKDVGGSTVTTANGPTFLVSDAPLRIDATGTTITATEAASTGPVVLATLTDANPGDHTADFTTAIDWGDGTPIDTTSGAVTFNPATGIYTITGSHIYPEEGTFFASVHVTDDDGFSVDTHFGLNDAGVVVTAPAQAPGAWYTDRFPPNAFVGGQTAQGRTGVIDEHISPADADGSRPAAFNSPFYDTQGRKYDLPPGTTYATIDLFVPLAWSTLSQQDTFNPSQPGNFGLLASFWATGVDNANTVTSFPIIAFNNNVAPSTAGAVGFRVFDQTNGYTNVPGFTGYNQWYQLSMAISGPDVVYFINGQLIYTDTTATGSTHLSDVILQGYNGGNDYHIDWNPVQDTPASVADVPVTINANSGAPFAPINEATSSPGGVVGTFTDPGNPAGTIDSPQTLPEYAAVINWGDGTITTLDTIANPTSFNFIGGGVWQVIAPAHPYAEEGTFPITLSITHDALAAVGPTQTDSITVNDVPVTINANSGDPLAPIDEGTTMPGGAIIGTFNDPGNPTGTIDSPQVLPEYAAVIDWGDGTTTPLDT
ncbi:MAG TPA: hypothetical protein VN641_15325, partial [Urbifossiella sp.]|nr:hypothetical protein [Urbifossiella sp.]